MAEALTNLQQLSVNRQVEQYKKEMEQNSLAYAKIAEMTGLKADLISILHKTVAKGTTQAELVYFLTYCKSVGLSPINKEIWCYKDSKDNVIIFTGRDGFLKKNKESPGYLGMAHSDVCEYDEFELDKIEGTIKHKITNNRGKVIGAYCIVWYEGKKPTIQYIDFDEFNLGQAKWKSSPKMMIDKCAQSLTLKEAAGLTGIQAEEAFVVKNDIAYSTEERKIDKIDKQQKEDERLELMIQNCKTEEALNKLMKECITPEQIQMWDAKKKELNLV